MGVLGQDAGKLASQGAEQSGAGADSERFVTVYVDAKIVGAHDAALAKNAFVGYYVELSGEHKEKPVEAYESDDAEIHAILFAVEDLKQKLGSLRIICDHQSVVSEANRVAVKNPSPLLVRLRDVMRENETNIRLVAIQYNLAHGTLTEYVNSRKSQ